MAKKNNTTPLQLSDALLSLDSEFQITRGMVQEIAAAFQMQMQAGLLKRPASLKMLPAFIGRPSGNERGSYLALDFGGTNIRVMLVNLQGNGCYQVTKNKSFPLICSQEGYDLTSPDAVGTDMFDYIAKQIKTILDQNERYLLGHTFSFPSCHTGINAASLICWTKEIRTREVEGKDITHLLDEALQRAGIKNVKPVAILNDTVAAMLAGAYGDRNCDIGSICGTGHNTCYFEPNGPDGLPMAINMESGNFDDVPFSVYDWLLDNNSHRPGEQRLEKLVGGCYLGEIVRLIAADMVEEGAMFPDDKGNPGMLLPYSIKTEYVSSMIADETPGLSNIKIWCRDHLGISNSTWEERAALKHISGLVVTRAASLVAATYIGILNHIDAGHNRTHSLVIDGSLYQKLPGFADRITAVLNDHTVNNGQGIRLIKAQDASGVGAAVAASLCAAR